MTLDDYEEPKGAYYSEALVARYPDQRTAEAAVSALRTVGFGQRDIQVGRNSDGITVVISNPSTGLMEQGRAILLESGAPEVRPYGSAGLPS